ncbi:MAG: hypothetical protein QOJ40_146 [Verrucomicrobiota bacterium]
MTLNATVSFKGKTESFKVADAGHGKDWAETRAVAYFFFKHPELALKEKGLSFRQIKFKAVASGAVVTLEERA